MDTNLILKQIDAAIERAGNRRHGSRLGAASIGDECKRKLWYKWRWAKPTFFPAQTLRIFERGNVEEARFVSYLRSIGCEVWTEDTNREQFGIADFNEHFAGRIDGVARKLPGLDPALPVLCEFKTHNDKWFKHLKANGLPTSQYKHFAQMQVYMYKLNLTLGLYMAVNKNDDELYLEFVPCQRGSGAIQIAKARLVIEAQRPPAKVNQSPSFFLCKMCDFRDVCHFGEQPEKNCRTCEFSAPVANAEWRCNWYGTIQTRQAQLDGCTGHQNKKGCFGKAAP